MARCTNERRQKQISERLGEENLNYQGYIMKIVGYNTSHDIIVEFQDEYKKCVHTTYRNFLNGKVKNSAERLGHENCNSQGCLMKVVNYDNANNIMVEFQDKYKSKVHTSYQCFLLGDVRNPYYPSVRGIGIVGEKYPVTINNKITKEYQTWDGMLKRCYDEKYKKKYKTYQDVTYCEEWILYENFYEWLHKQENFDKWLNGDRWTIDKDILVKWNKVYSPETCCLVPESINLLFRRNEPSRGELPIGVTKNGNLFMAQYMNSLVKEREYLGSCSIPQQAFLVYKRHKEDLIKQMAEDEYNNKNITKQCYEAMINYEVEIDD